jgi:hypothetical protein
MKIQNKKTYSKSKIIITSTILVILIISSLALYIYAFNGSIFGWSLSNKASQDSSINYEKPSDDQKKAGDTIKETSANNESDSTKPGTSGSDQPQAPVPQDNGKGKVEMTITSSSVNDGVLQLRSIISAISSTGTCTLTLSKDGKTVTKTASVQALANASTCQGFNVNTSELSPGSWLASLHFENTTLLADTSKMITVE